MCEILQNWDHMALKLQNQGPIKSLIEDMGSFVEMIGRTCLDKQAEAVLYRTALTANQEESKVLLRASLDDLVDLKKQNGILQEQLDGKHFQDAYCQKTLQATASLKQLKNNAFQANLQGSFQ